MAEVFEAEEDQLGQRVALKRLHPNIAERAGASARFLREGKAVARVRHPNVVQVLALGEDEGTPYLAMELLEGEDLGAVLEREGRLTVHKALDVLLPVLAGVSAAHEAGVIHRDLKPSNVFLTRGPGGTSWPKVIDFGISKVLESDMSSVTDSEAVVGTVAYMAPEQARAVRNASFQSDQYSLGVLLYECLTGRRPFSGQGVIETLHSIMTAPVPGPSTLESGVSAKLDGVVLRAMDRDPARRFSSLSAMGAALIPFASASAAQTWQRWFESRCAGVSSSGESWITSVAPPSDEAAPRTQVLTGSAREARPGGRAIRRMTSALAAVVLIAGAVIAGARQRPVIAAPTTSVSKTPAPPTFAIPTTSPTTTPVDSASPTPTNAPPVAASTVVTAPSAHSSEALPARPPHRSIRPAASASPSPPAAASPPIPVGKNDAPILP